MSYVNIVTALAVLQFMVFGFKVGSARGHYSIKAPAVTGNDLFERHFRVQQNTLEQLVTFLPSLYLFSRYFNPLVAAALGVVYLMGRELYAAAYVKDPEKRGPWFGLTFLPTVILIVGGVVGAIRELI
jgi:glutathione S-transferase